MMFTIDGVTWPWPCSIHRTASVTSSDISGMMLDRSYFNDVLGTYLSYDVSLAVPLTDRDSYTALYNLLTAPVDGHEFIFPYNQGTVQITARVEEVPDVFTRLKGDGKYWREISFTVTANHPTRAVTLAEAITRGRAPLPDIADPQEGDNYTFRDGHWSLDSFYPNADLIAY